jgi:hypothetical protein
MGTRALGERGVAPRPRMWLNIRLRMTPVALQPDVKVNVNNDVGVGAPPRSPNTRRPVPPAGSGPGPRQLLPRPFAGALGGNTSRGQAGLEWPPTHLIRGFQLSMIQQLDCELTLCVNRGWRRRLGRVDG